jgi:hypothetical protein
MTMMPNTGFWFALRSFQSDWKAKGENVLLLLAVSCLNVGFCFRLVPATPGELIRVRREDVRNGVANGELHGIKGTYPMSADYVRWINEFVVAGCDHEATEEGELSYKCKDFILVLEALEGKAAEGKADPW